MGSVVNRSAALVATLDGRRGQPVQLMLARILRQVTVLEDAVQLSLDPAAVAEALGLAAAEGRDVSYVDRILRLTFLAPGIVEAALAGTAPADFNFNRLKDVKRIALSWADQGRLMGFAPTTN